MIRTPKLASISLAAIGFPVVFYRNNGNSDFNKLILSPARSVVYLFRRLSDQNRAEKWHNSFCKFLFANQRWSTFHGDFKQMLLRSSLLAYSLMTSWGSFPADKSAAVISPSETRGVCTLCLFIGRCQLRFRVTSLPDNEPCRLVGG